MPLPITSTTTSSQAPKSDTWFNFLAVHPSTPKVAAWIKKVSCQMKDATSCYLMDMPLTSFCQCTFLSKKQIYPGAVIV